MSSLQEDFERLLGSPQADYSVRNTRLAQVLDLVGLQFERPSEDQQNYQLKGTASLCANMAFKIIFDMFEDAHELFFRGKSPLFSRVSVVCKIANGTTFPFVVTNGEAVAHQTSLAMHRPERRRNVGVPFRPSIIGEQSFRGFWFDLVLQIVNSKVALVREEVVYELRKQGIFPTPVMLNAGLMAAVSMILSSRSAADPISQAWMDCGISRSHLERMVGEHFGR